MATLEHLSHSKNKLRHTTYVPHYRRGGKASQRPFRFSRRLIANIERRSRVRVVSCLMIDRTPVYRGEADGLIGRCESARGTSMVDTSSSKWRGPREASDGHIDKNDMLKDVLCGLLERSKNDINYN